MRLFSAFASGLLFALGLGLGDMTQPAKVIGFLDIAGHWDPTLVFVLAGAVAVSTGLFGRILRRPAPLLGESFVLPGKKTIDAPLLIGAAVFGVGWGLGGYCPGPALVSLVTLTPGVLVFVVAMALGFTLGARLVERP